MAFHQAGNVAEAERCYKAILAAKPDQLEALYYLGILEAQLGRHEEALASYDRVLALMPDNAAAIYNRGVILQKLARYEAALASYDQALVFAPDDVEVLTNRGITLYELKRYEEALASYDKALTIKPDFVEALNNRGNVLRELSRPEEALASCDKALAIKPDYLEALTNRGIALEALKRHDEALASYDEALAINPNYADAHWAASLCSLALGDFERGWQEYEWRWKTADFPSPRRQFQRPLWLGQKSIRGKTILLYGEQGLGDTIQFCRYVEFVAQKGARVILEAQPPLKSLLAGLDGVQQVLAAGEPLPEFDFQCPLVSLPLAFKTTLETVPARVPYLKAAPGLVGQWRARLARTMGPHDLKIGICWQGEPTAKVDMGRSISLREFHPLSRIPGVRLISLQKHHGLDQLDNLPSGMVVEILGDDFDSGSRAFVDSVAVMENIDLIITSDTSVAHLGGALGRPTWVALKYVPDWRWTLDRNDSPWYPTMRVFRQSKPDDWHAVFEVMSRELAALVSSR
jgi:tetratricopeptide (TPR) repeat protein